VTAEPSAAKARSFKLGELSDLLGYVRPYRGRFFLAVAALLVSMAFGLSFPFLVGHLVDAAIPSAATAPTDGWKPTVDAVALTLAGTLAIQALLTFFYSYSFNKVGESAVVRVRRALYARLIALPMKFYGEHRVGELASRLSNDLTLLSDTLAGTIPQALRQAMMLLGGVVMIALTSLRLSLVMICSFPVLMLVAVFFGRKVRRFSREAQDRLAESATIVEETFQGIANVKAFGNEAHEVRRYTAGLDGYLQTILRTSRRRAGLVSFIILGIFGSIILVLWYGARLMQAGQLSHGQLTRFTLYTIFVGGAVSSFAEVFSQLQKTLGANERVRELMAETAEIDCWRDGQIDAGVSPDDAAALPVRLRGEVAFEQISFRYPSRPDLPVLRELSLEAKAGERIALVGPSGAGKSTIVSLLLRFYEPDTGRILLDGQDARSLDLATVRGNMAIVPQEVLLFGGSIRDNIAYGRPAATEAEIIEAARRAQCAEFIERFPEGYATLVGERGVKLSGGQRQRLAIARALLKDPAILLLDEATSSLDSESEALIQQALAELLRGRTAFIVAHRLATVREADCIYVIEQGQVAERGTHDELIQREGGTYRRLAEMQFAS
jgi:ATP-binding cassette subfamily B protein